MLTVGTLPTLPTKGRNGGWATVLYAGMTSASVFDQVRGLPLHVLVVHLVVVGVPLMALVTIVVAARPGWRRSAGWPVAAAMAALLAVTFVATQSGEQLERRVGEPAVVQHSALGDRLPWFVLAMLAVSVLVAAAGDHRGPAVVGLVLAVVVGVAAVWWTIRVGESGAQAVWGGVISSTDPSGSAPSARTG